MPDPTKPAWLQDLHEHLVQAEEERSRTPSVARSAMLGFGSGATMGFLDELRGVAGSAAPSESGYRPQAATDSSYRASGASPLPPTPRDLKAQYPGLSYTDAYRRWFNETRPDLTGSRSAEAERQQQEGRYYEARNAAREEEALAQKAHPTAFGVPRAAGIMASATAIPTSSLRLASDYTTLLPEALASRILNAGATSAVVGGLLGTGQSSELKDIPHEAAQGAMDAAKTGAVFSAATPLGIAGLRKAGIALKYAEDTKEAARIAALPEADRLRMAEEEIATNARIDAGIQAARQNARERALRQLPEDVRERLADYEIRAKAQYGLSQADIDRGVDWEADRQRRMLASRLASRPQTTGSSALDWFTKQADRYNNKHRENPSNWATAPDLTEGFMKAKGGRVPRMADGGLAMVPSHGQPPIPSVQPQPGSSADLLAQQQAIEQRFTAPMPAQQVNDLTQMYAGLPAAAAGLPPEAARQLQAQMAQQQAQAAQPKQVDPFAGVLGMMQPPTGAAMAIGKAQQQQAEAEAGLAREQSAWVQEQQRWTNDARAKIDADYEATIRDYRNGRIDPNRVFNDRTTAQKALSIVGLIFGGIGSGLTGQPNAALQVMQSQIERDVQAQVAEMDKRRNLVSMNLQRYGNLDAAIKASTIQQTAYYETRLQDLASTSNAAQAMPNAQIAMYHMRATMFPMMMQLAQYQGLQNMIRSGGHVVGDQPAPWTWEDYMARAMPGPANAAGQPQTTFARSPEDRKAAVEKLQKWGAYGDAVDALQNARSAMAAIPAGDAAALYNQEREKVLLQLMQAMPGTGRGEAEKIVDRLVPGGFDQWLHGDAITPLRELARDNMHSIWETHGSLRFPRLPPVTGSTVGAAKAAARVPAPPDVEEAPHPFRRPAPGGVQRVR